MIYTGYEIENVRHRLDTFHKEAVQARLTREAMGAGKSLMATSLERLKMAVRKPTKARPVVSSPDCSAC